MVISVMLKRYVDSSELILINSAFFNNNFALTNGTAIILSNSIAEIYDSRFENSILGNHAKRVTSKMTKLDRAMSGTIKVDKSSIVS